MCKQTWEVSRISASVHKRRMIRRWPENVPKISRNRGNVIDLLTGKMSATTPPPTESDPVTEITEEKILLLPPPPLNVVGSRRGDENVPGGPLPKKSWLRRCGHGQFGQFCSAINCNNRRKTCTALSFFRFPVKLLCM